MSMCASVCPVSARCIYLSIYLSIYICKGNGYAWHINYSLDFFFKERARDRNLTKRDQDTHHLQGSFVHLGKDEL